MLKLDQNIKQPNSSRRGVPWLLTCLALAVIAGCVGPQPSGQPTGLENISAPSPTPKASPTPSRDVAGAEVGAPGGSLLGGFVSDPAGSATEPVPAEISGPDGAAPEGHPPTVEPVELAVDLTAGDLNTWIEVSPPPGWRITQGLDGILIAQEPGAVPESPFVLVRRWGNVVNLGDYLAYLPDAVEESGSNVAFRMGGYDWDGVFLSAEDHRYRAFFGVSADVVPSFTLLVYVPVRAVDDVSLTREDLLTAWTFEVGDLNSILRRLAFY